MIRRRQFPWLLLLPVIAVTGILSPARAHEDNVVFSRLDVLPERIVRLELLIAGTDLGKIIGETLTIPGDIVNPLWLERRAEPSRAYLAERTAIGNPAGVVCAPLAGALSASYQSVEFLARFDCSAVPGELIYTTNVLFDVEPAAKHWAKVGDDPKVRASLLTRDANVLSITGPPPPLFQVLRRYTMSGIEHIFIGFDHIAFLLALILWATSFRNLVKIVTAFTVAHTITLSLAVLDIAALPPRLTEAAIAATLIYTAAENFVRRDDAHKWVVAFFLGLVHGFGFAGVLRAFGLPENNVIVALLTFNLGVEIGQILIVAIVYPMLITLDKSLPRLAPAGMAVAEGRSVLLVHAVSAAILWLGLFWMVTRLMPN